MELKVSLKHYSLLREVLNLARLRPNRRVDPGSMGSWDSPPRSAVRQTSHTADPPRFRHVRHTD